MERYSCSFVVKVSIDQGIGSTRGMAKRTGANQQIGDGASVPVIQEPRTSSTWKVIYKSNRAVPENHSHLSAITFPMPVSSDDPLDEVLRPPPDETPEQRELRLEREAEAKRISLAIDASIKAERQARRKKRIVRLLLLGQSESGM